MIFRFTLSNSITGTQIINEPDGWKGIKIKLERHPDYHSLIEMIDTDFFYYNANNMVDGGRQFIYNVEQTQGINAIVSLRIEISENGDGYQDVFTGNLDLSTIKDVSKGNKFYLFKCSIIPSDLWSTFQNRKSIPVDTHSTTDLNGNPVATPPDLSLLLTNQKVRQSFISTTDSTTYEDLPSGQYAQYDFGEESLNEIETKFNIGSGVNTDPPSPLWEIKLSGTYTFNLNLTAWYLAGGSLPGLNLSGKLTWSLLVQTQSGTTGYTLTRNDFTAGAGLGTYSVFSLNKVLNLTKGDSIFFYGNSSFHFAADTLIIFEADPNSPPSPLFFPNANTNLSILADTTFVNTQTDALLIHDVAESILDRIGGIDFYSEYLGGIMQGYSANGCEYLHALMKGLHVRGYSFADKPLSMSFDDWWNGSNPIFNLGLGPEIVAGVEKIRVEQKDHFYNDTPILTFNFVDGIERTYDKNLIVKSVKIGYSNWSAESASGIDDPQTNHSYSTIYKLIGSDIILQSSFIAASLAIEQTRRNRKEIGKDWRLDDNIIIISLSNDDGSPGDIFPEVGSPFSNVTNLLNAITRYNIRITPYRNFKRWIKYLSASLQKYLTSSFKFNSGEGNYTMVVGANSDTCDTGTWSENQNISPSSTPYTTAEMYRFVVPLSFTDYQTLKANRTHAILVSPTDSNHKTCHIATMEYEIAKAEATITAWIK